MAPILRVKAAWSGFSGAPGFTVLHFRDFGTGEGTGAAADVAQAQSAVDRTRAFFDGIKQYLPAVARVDVQGDVDVIESTNGELITSLTAAPPVQVAGTATGNYSAASGSVVNWRTGGVRNGRKVRGRTFLVPLASQAMDTQGQLGAVARNTIQTAALTLSNSAGSPDLGVYARPTIKGATDGAWYVVSGISVSNKVAVLTSRRD